jgi:hypothetical protein
MTKHHSEHSGWAVGDVVENGLGRQLLVIGIVEYHPGKVDIHYVYSDSKSVGARSIEATTGWRKL